MFGNVHNAKSKIGNSLNDPKTFKSVKVTWTVGQIFVFLYLISGACFYVDGCDSKVVLRTVRQTCNAPIASSAKNIKVLLFMVRITVVL